MKKGKGKGKGKVGGEREPRKSYALTRHVSDVDTERQEKNKMTGRVDNNYVKE